MKKMKKAFIFLGALLLLLVSHTLPLLSKTPISRASEIEGTEQELIEKVFDDAIEESMASKKITGATATLVVEGKVLLQKGYGYSDKELNVSVDTSESGFRIGSISKTFVAIAAMIAMEEGKLDLDTDITSYLEKDFLELKYPVTMKQLLTHTAGFEDLITGIAVKDISDIEPLAETVRKYKPEQIFKPGEIISYSNYGIALAGYVIEQATGIDMAEYCKERIFLPLGMNNTTLNYKDNKVTLSKAYLPNGNETPEPYVNMYVEGAGLSTAEDMSIYIKWLLGDQENILKNETKNRLFMRNYSMAEELNGIGYTWNIKERNGIHYYEKKGETLNFYSKIVIYPDSNTGLFLSFNTFVSDEEINAIINKVTECLLGSVKHSVQSQGATLEIEGSYTNARSSFKTAEKYLRYILPQKILKITRASSGEYKLNGETITHLGNNAYDTSIGKLKFMEKDGKILIATNFSQTYLKISTAESMTVILIVLTLFLISTIFISFKIIINLFKKRSMPPILVISNLAQFVAFVLLCLVLVMGLMNYSILLHVIWIRLAAWSILAATILTTGYLLFIRLKNGNAYMTKYFVIHNIFSIAFCLVMFTMNLLY